MHAFWVSVLRPSKEEPLRTTIWILYIELIVHAAISDTIAKHKSIKLSM